MPYLMYKIRHANETDLDEIFQIENDVSGSWNKKYFLNELNNSFSIFIVAEISNEVAGFAVAWDVRGEIQLNNIAVKKIYRKNGIASSLIDRIVMILKDKNPEKIFIEVREKNKAARLFYKKFGFFETGLRKNYYINDNAILMEKDIKNEI